MTVSPLGGLTDAEVEAAAEALARAVTGETWVADYSTRRVTGRWATIAITAALPLIRERVIRECVAELKWREQEALADMKKNPVGSVERTLDTEKAVGWGRAARALTALLAAPPADGGDTTQGERPMSDPAAAYTASADRAVVALREWADGRDLPDDPWKLPKDCPIWNMGLSLFQASWALAAVRREFYPAAPSGDTASGKGERDG